MKLPPSLSLDDLPAGARATVKSLRAAAPEADAALLRRLAEIGFVDGEPVHLLRRGPGGREPLAVQVGDTLFALRALEARCIEVERVDV
jgi:ferrous iron transport protein A